MARSRADALNTYDQLLHPFDGWTFGAYAHEAGQFGLGESKGAVNFVAGSVVDLSPALQIADAQVEGRLSAPIAATGTQAEGGGFIQPVLIGASFLTGEGEIAAVEGGAAKVLGRVVRAGGNCFVAGTLVQMADGTTEPIEQIKVGEWVKSRNPQTGKVEAKRVDRVYVRLAPQVLTLTFTDGATGRAEAFTCTPEHPFLVDGRGFVRAEDLGIGTSLVTRAGPFLTLSAVARGAAPALGGVALGGQAHPAGIRVYNLRVEDDHSYFVGTLHGGICVHNAEYPVVAGEAGRFGDLDARAVGGDDLTPHHMPQAALGFTSREEGGALVLPHDEHMDTRTYFSKGRLTRIEDADKPFRDVLAKDIRDVRGIARSRGNLRKYNRGIQDLLGYYRANHPTLIRK